MQRGIVAKRAVRWKPKERIEETLVELATLQARGNRDLEIERTIAKDANEYLHERDTQDLMLCVELHAASAFWTRYLPKARLVSRSDRQRCAVDIAGSVEAASKLESRSATRINTYFHGFELGVDLGYPEEMGDKWYIYLSDSGGSFYVPVDAVDMIIDTGF